LRRIVMGILEAIKNNPLAILGSLVSIVAIVSALFTVDSRYAHSAEVQKDKVQTQQLIKETSKEMRKQSLEDKLFELDVKKEQAPNQRLSPVDSALRERYQRQLNEINSK
jgi:hypothetical protein